jgi:hypothetical protein
MLSADDSEAALAAKLDPRFYDLVERSERNVDQIERAEVLLKTGFELDGAILRNQHGERVDPETLRGTSVGKSFWAASTGIKPSAATPLTDEPAQRFFSRRTGAPTARPSCHFSGPTMNSRMLLRPLATPPGLRRAARCFLYFCVSTIYSTQYHAW